MFVLVFFCTLITVYSMLQKPIKRPHHIFPGEWETERCLFSPLSFSVIIYWNHSGRLVSPHKKCMLECALSGCLGRVNMAFLSHYGETLKKAFSAETKQTALRFVVCWGQTWSRLVIYDFCVFEELSSCFYVAEVVTGWVFQPQALHHLV